MDSSYDIETQLAELSKSGSAPEVVALLKELYEEHPDSVSIVLSLLANGWTFTPSGESVICITLRSGSGSYEVLGHGSTYLDAFEDIQLKTRNFSKLLAGVDLS